MPKTNTKGKGVVIPYPLIKHIVNSCTDKRTQALIVFQYIMGSRAGELAMEYNHKKKKIKSEGIRRDLFIETDSTLEWESPNFKNSKKLTKRAFIFKHEEVEFYSIMKLWLASTSNKKYIFNIRHTRIKQLIDKELKQHNKKYSSHCLRHSRASHIAFLSGNPYAVKEILGHANLETSAQYVSIGKEIIRKSLEGKSFEEILGGKV